MKRLFYLSIILFALFFSGCKKQKPVVFSGQLLLSKKNPQPLNNRKIEVYQAGSSSAIGLNSGSTSSSANTQTDATGNFRLSFTPGTSSFIIFTSANSSQLTLGSASDDTAFPRFSRKGFSNSDASSPTYVGKIIDTALIKVSLSSDLTLNDTIGVRAYTINGNIDKEYTRRVGTVGSVIILDTLYNMLFTDFDCLANKFTNTLYAGRKFTTVHGYVTISSYGIHSPYQLSADDETKQEIMFYYQK